MLSLGFENLKKHLVKHATSRDRRTYHCTCSLVIYRLARTISMGHLTIRTFSLNLTRSEQGSWRDVLAWRPSGSGPRRDRSDRADVGPDRLGRAMAAPGPDVKVEPFEYPTGSRPWTLPPIANLSDTTDGPISIDALDLPEYLGSRRSILGMARVELYLPFFTNSGRRLVWNSPRPSLFHRCPAPSDRRRAEIRLLWQPSPGSRLAICQHSPRHPYLPLRKIVFGLLCRYS